MVFFVSTSARIRIDCSLRHSRQEAFKLNKKGLFEACRFLKDFDDMLSYPFHLFFAQLLSEKISV